MSTPTSSSTITLRRVTEESARDVMKLQVAPEQTRFVAPNTVSIAQAYFERDKAWFRAIYADETPVGFVMLYDDPRKPVYFLWRLMIDARYQGLGFGRKAVRLLIDYVKTRPQATELKVSYAPGDGNPGPFYQSLGFIETGEIEHGEHVMSLPLTYDDGARPAPALGKPLTHVVLFKLKDNSAESVQATIDQLRSLDGQVPTLRSIEVGANVVASSRAYDIGLITRFDDLAGMEAYQVHPVHQEVLAYMGTVVERAVAVDFESAV